MSENTEQNIIVEVPLLNHGDFITKHQKEINIITDKVIDLIKSNNIDVNAKTINTSQILRIISEINKTINKMKNMYCLLTSENSSYYRNYFPEWNCTVFL